MTERRRPRLNITLDPEIKKRVLEVSEDLDVTVSRLIEEVLHEFLELYRNDPTVGMDVKKSVTERKNDESTRKEKETRKQIEAILEDMN